MGSLFLLIIYVAIFVAQIVLLVKSIRGKKYWIGLILLEIFSIIVSIILWYYYESLPGYGFMPGLSYIGESLLSIGIAIIYFIMLVVTIGIKIIVCARQKKQKI